MDESKKAMLKKIGVTALALFFIFYVVREVYRISFDKVETVMAVETQVNNSLFTKGFFIREEEYIINSASGTVVPVAEDGKKVSGGDAVAMVFGDDQSVNCYMRAQTLKEELERYKKLNSITPSSAIDKDGLDSAIDVSVSDLADAINSGDLDSLSSYYASLRDSITKKQLMLGEDINFQSIIDGINNELEMIEKQKISYQTISASGSGYYIAEVDGYESTFDYSQVKSITPEQADALFNQQKAEVPENVMGKLVTGFNWYIVCKLEIKDIADLSPGSKVTVDFPYSSTLPLEAWVDAINVSGADTAAVVLRCNMMNEELANMREEDIEIIFNSVTGFKIPVEAVREDEDRADKGTENEGTKYYGVYVLRSNTVTFKKINIIWSDENYVICADDEIKIYDQVVVKGKNLSDGKAIN